jgi:uncharacterized repeat protein (TIGR01451 family)
MNTAPKFATIATALLQAVVWICALKLSAGTVAAQCTSTSSVPNQTISSGTVCYSDNDTLTAAAVTVNGSADVRFLAGQRVNLTPGFRATAGTAATTFHAWVETVPSAVSASPSGGTGLTQAFTWTVSNPEGYGEIDEVQAIFGATLGGWGRCYIRYSRASNLVYLTDDSEVAWLGGFAPGTHGTANNSRCAVTGSGASVHGSGTHLTVTVPVTFQAGWAGVKNQYLNVWDLENLSSGWQTMGTWTVGSGGTQYYLTTAVSPVGSGSILPACATGCTYAGSSQVQIFATPGSGYQFVNWTGNVANPHLPTTTVTMTNSQLVTANFVAAGSSQLSITSQHSGNFIQTQTAVYTLTVSNAAGAGATSGMVTVTDTLPPGLSFASMSGAGWSCSGANCSRSDPLAAGASYPPIALTVNVAANATSPQVNQAAVSGGGSSPAMTSDSTVTGRVTTNIQDFRICIGSNGTAGVCRLTPGRRELAANGDNAALRIQRSDFVITGSGGPADTTLVRNSISFDYIMFADATATNVTITNLTFDGNRYGFGTGPGGAISCLGLQQGAAQKYWDLDLILLGHKRNIL